ncbi:WhiB family transcriptional regulator [Streptomyces sp. NPDC012466]|jgi:WhiB family redox-sensing transcriptional regulator|uniref:WhiB family transcriptional regulator n=1 Tax=Streptomyces sp. NPDC012466 TaxID=3364835 RepID=UPI0036E1705D
MPDDRRIRHRTVGAGVAETLATARGWLREAACLGEDPELFFPLVERETDAQVAQARAVCRRCRVLLACRSWAIEQGEDAGIWGATTARQRRAISRETRGGIGRRSAP